MQKDDAWYPALLVGKDGDNFKVRYLADDGGQATVGADEVRHLFGGNPQENIPKGLFRQGRPKPDA